MKDFIKDGVLLAKHISGQDISTGLSFFTRDNDYLQVGSWKYEKGRKLAAHIHNLVIRQCDKTQECIVIMKGSLKAVLYDNEGHYHDEFVAKSGDAIILFSGGHGYEIIEDDTIVFEIKNGPYPGAETDRRRI